MELKSSTAVYIPRATPEAPPPCLTSPCRRTATSASSSRQRRPPPWRRRVAGGGLRVDVDHHHASAAPDVVSNASSPPPPAGVFEVSHYGGALPKTTMLAPPPAELDVVGRGRGPQFDLEDPMAMLCTSPDDGSLHCRDFIFTRAHDAGGGAFGLGLLSHRTESFNPLPIERERFVRSVSSQTTWVGSFYVRPHGVVRVAFRVRPDESCGRVSIVPHGWQISASYFYCQSI